MYVPILGHFDFKVEYPSVRVKVGTFFVVHVLVTDPLHLDQPVDHMEGDLAVWVKNSLGTETEYEVVRDDSRKV